MRFLPVVLASIVLVGTSAAQSPAAKTLDIYLIDVEGGNATLFVTPAGESVLMDTGNRGAGAVRDAGRIMEAAKAAGLTRIDHLITTHWHGDHFGGLAELASRIPIRHFIDHGPSIEPEAANDEFQQKGYPALYAKAKHTVAKPGDALAVAGLEWRVVSSAGEVLKTPLPGAGKPNPYCGNYKLRGPDVNPDNDASLGSVITFGRFRAVHLGDLTQDKEHALMCPNNRIGKADLFIVSHHGLARSNSRALIHAISPTVAIMNNGTRKGGDPETMKLLYSSPGFEDLWQLHFSVFSGQEYTAPGLFIANQPDESLQAMPVAPLVASPGTPMPPAAAHNGPAHWIKVSAQQDGTFTVTNTRNGFSKTYGPGRESRPD